ncbi:IS1182 family transposase [Aliiglaciecola sp. 2_MG-2023]|uniref:IS1182 family transposase n=1 Tax=unclassified Aliiglaciecola TaxID=2593648 RepID=UPI0026E3D40E|nr:MULTISPECIES: IS1182 family transposase [unclassified Aliiglaciecola]MDO6711384.1 IS1182 family transposase [Aliiglaciecola sp. 2_MG-2023]MDO6752167.1 IS1182 family transposase [Aliiglaciecola sp. 1_MG-2023]
MSHHIQDQGRQQTTLFPEALDDFVTDDNPVRVIDVFVDEIDLVELGFERVHAKRTGRPGYHPATLLKLYIYGYLNRIQSSRRLEKESHRNVELMWLLERLTPDFKTIADFRKDNGKAVKGVCRQFIELCRQMNMFSESLIAIDGSKFKAVNNKSRNYTSSKVKFHITRVENSIQEYLDGLDKQDKDNQQTEEKASSSKIKWLRKRLAELKKMEETVQEHPDKQVSLTDPDSRLMKLHHLNRQVCYNVQSAVDTKHHLIVSHDIVQSTDMGYLTLVAKQVQEALNKQDITVIADKGYFSRNDIKLLDDIGVTALIPQSDTSGAKLKGIFNKSLFKYDKEKDIYICPAGEELQNRMRVFDSGLEQDVYFNHIACRDCTIRAKCTTAKRDPRRMRRWVHEKLIDTMQTTLDESPETTVLRKQTVEHPFGTIKMWMGSTHFLMRRLKNVKTEMSLHVLAYNLRRMISIFGVPTLIQAMKA